MFNNVTRHSFSCEEFSYINHNLIKVWRDSTVFYLSHTHTASRKPSTMTYKTDTIRCNEPGVQTHWSRPHTADALSQTHSHRYFCLTDRVWWHGLSPVPLNWLRSKLINVTVRWHIQKLTNLHLLPKSTDAATWPIISCPIENHCVIGWSVIWGGAVVSSTAE